MSAMQCSHTPLDGLKCISALRLSRAELFLSIVLANKGAHCNLSCALKVISFEHFAVIVGAEFKRHLLRFAFEYNQLAVIHSVP